ncbi:MAG: hypothetical protein KDD94_10840, partial [Calditrichaeota bacterium]|nr:hypothetical protein [Calditrichota bacterium]
PESIKHYFDQEVENWIIEEEVKFESSDRFDYDKPEVRQHIDQIFDHLKSTATFDINKFNQLLERAIKLEKDFTIRPQWTMTNFFFKDSDKVRTKQINDALRYFFVHDHYKSRLTEYFNLKYLQEINSEQFKVLIKEIDDKIYNANPKDEAANLVKTIVAFVNQGTDDKDKLSVEVLIQAFKDRHNDAMTKLFEDQKKNGKDTLSLDEILKVIQEGGAETETKQEEVQLDDIDISDVKAPEVEEEEEDEEDDIEEEEEEKAAPASEPEPEPAAPAASASQDPVIDEDDRARQMAEVLSSNVSSGEPLGDLAELIDRRDRRKFVKKLFKKDENAFNQFITSINALQNWKDASTMIEDEFYNRDINPYSKEALSFSDIAYTRFFPKDNYV